MSGTPLSRYAGPITFLVGVYMAVTHVALFFVLNRGDGDRLVLVADPVFRVVNVAYAAAFAGLFLTLFAAYTRQAREAGGFGLIALFAAIVGTFTLGADMWFEGFATPWLLEVFPQLLTAERTTIWVIGYFSSYVLFALGWALFGLDSLAPEYSRYPSALLLRSVASSDSWRPGRLGALHWASPSPWLGRWLITADRTDETNSEPAMLSTRNHLRA